MKLEFISKSLDYLNNNPTTSGVTDSSQALAYYEPKGDK